MGVDTRGRSKIVGLDMTRIVQARWIDSTSLVLALGLEEVAPARPHLWLWAVALVLVEVTPTSLAFIHHLWPQTGSGFNLVEHACPTGLILIHHRRPKQWLF